MKRNAFGHLWKRRGALSSCSYFRSYSFGVPLSLCSNLFSSRFHWLPLAYPVFYRPISRGMRRVLPRFPPNRLSELSAVLSTLTLVLFMLSPILLLLMEATKSPQGFGNMVISLALGEDEGGKFSYKVLVREFQRCGQFTAFTDR